MNRRSFLTRLAALTGVAALGGARVLEPPFHETPLPDARA